MPASDELLRVFVSHIHEEKRLGKVVKDFLQDAFSNRIAVFVSSDPRDNPGGDKWLERIQGELNNTRTRMLISLVSPQSVREPWICIELGAAWILSRAVFPLCHSGQQVETLPRPLGDFGGADLEQDDAAVRLIGAVERATGLSVPERWSREGFLAAMRAAVPPQSDTVGPAASTAPPVTKAHALEQSRSTAPTGKRPALFDVRAQAVDGLSDSEITVLRVLADAKNNAVQWLEYPHIASYAKLKLAEVELAIHELEEREFVGRALGYSQPPGAYIKPYGLKWLSRNGML